MKMIGSANVMSGNEGDERSSSVGAGGLEAS